MDKKIGILIDRLNTGGVEKTAIQQVKALQELGYDATLLILSKNAVVKDAHKELLSKIKVEYLDQQIPNLLQITFKFPYFAFLELFHFTYPILLSIFADTPQKYDLIISHGSYTTFSAWALKKFRRLNYSIYFWDPIHFILNRVYSSKIPTPVIVVLSWIAKTIDKILCQDAQVIFVAANTHNDYFINECNVSKDKISRIPPGTPLGKPAHTKSPHVLMVTTWKEGKHPEYVFKIVDKNPKLKIHMVGRWLDKQMLKNFKQKINTGNYSKNIELLGEANEERLQKLYPEAAVLLTTNYEKGFGMPILEASACGTSFIAVKGSGANDFFTHGTEGFFTKEQDTETIVKYLTKFTTDLDFAKKQGLVAYKAVAKGFTWKDHALKLISNIK